MPFNAYPDSSADLWDQNIVNGEYIIAYELNPGLDRKIHDMLPEVSSDEILTAIKFTKYKLKLWLI